MPEHLEFARKKNDVLDQKHRIKYFVEGSITDLSKFSDSSFDIVLCLGGALSHVTPESDRRKAVTELVRVAKPGSPIFVSVMSKFGTLVRFYKWINELEDSENFERFYKKGDDYQWAGGKAYAHFFELNELKNLFSKGTEFIEQVGLEGLATPVRE